jgi:signal transduction histidine kinase
VADVDPMRIEQALGNLVDNALVHGEGEVTLHATGEEDTVRICVGDEGGGFPEGFEDRAFERFTRADEGRTGAGAGLGLAIVRTIARAHGGDAWVESRGDGARAVLTIPG